jgi:hypothetical protein
MLSVLLSLFAITFCLGQETYEDYSVLRLYDMTDENVASFIAEDIDVWASSKIEGWADVMIHRDRLSEFVTLYKHKVVFENVQEEVNRSLAENDQARAASTGKRFAFDHFPTPAEVNAYITEVAGDYPQWASAIVIGNSYAGAQIRALHLNNGSPNAPFFGIHCTIHAREWITTTTCAYIIDRLLTTNTNLLQYFNWVIIPVLNVDGYAYTHSSTRLWRKNRQPNSGSCVGTDLNRNYRIGWGGGGSSADPCSDTYRGTAAFSGPEINAERAYFANKNVALFVDIHAYGSMFMSPYGYTATYPPNADYIIMDDLMEDACNAIYNVNGFTYAYGPVYHVIYQASGGSNDWSYGEQRIVGSFALEARGTSFTPPVSQINPVGSEICAGIFALANNAYSKINQQQ